MWLWKKEKEYPLTTVPSCIHEYLTAQEKRRLSERRERLSIYSEFVCGSEERRLRFLRWLVQEGKLQGDTL